MQQKPYRHFAFLDGLRFLCALWVVFYHLGAPPIFKVWAASLPDNIAHVALMTQKGFGVMFNGTAAVVAFFIISGFCIHYPQASGKKISILPFYLARGTRIGLPILAAIAIAASLQNGLHAIGLVLWSLYCEVIYYALYPLLLVLFKRVGIRKVFIASFALSIGLALIPDHNAGYLWTYGVFLTWLLCLPMWLLGCAVAESVTSGHFAIVSNRANVMPAIRISILFFCGASSVLAAIGILSLKFTMLAFSPVCAIWILAEFSQTKGFSLFEKLSRFGQASFSIYLMHTIAPLVIAYSMGIDRTAQSWPLTMAGVGVLSTLFYFIIERPSHLLSKALGKLGRERTNAATLEAEIKRMPTVANPVTNPAANPVPTPVPTPAGLIASNLD